MDREVAVVRAYSLREQAQTMPVRNHHEDTRAKAAFLVAADAFLDCALAATKKNEHTSASLVTASSAMETT